MGNCDQPQFIMVSNLLLYFYCKEIMRVSSRGRTTELLRIVQESGKSAEWTTPIMQPLPLHFIRFWVVLRLSGLVYCTSTKTFAKSKAELGLEHKVNTWSSNQQEECWGLTYLLPNFKSCQCTKGIPIFIGNNILKYLKSQSLRSVWEKFHFVWSVIIVMNFS